MDENSGVADASDDHEDDSGGEDEVNDIRGRDDQEDGGDGVRTMIATHAMLNSTTMPMTKKKRDIAGDHSADAAEARIQC